MAEQVKFKDNSVERVAFDLMEKIASFEQDDNSGGEGARAYWFKLYVQCLKATRGSLLSSVLEAGKEG